MPAALQAEGGSATKRSDSRAAFTLAIASFIVTFDITAVVVAMPVIKAELGLGVSGFAWVMDA